MDWNTSFAEQLGQATNMVRNGNLMEATQAIQKALAGGTTASADTPAAPTANTAKPQRAKSAWRKGAAAAAAAAADVQDAVVIERGTAPRTARAAEAPHTTPITPTAPTAPVVPSIDIEALQESAMQTAREAMEAFSSLPGMSGMPDLSNLPGMPDLSSLSSLSSLSGLSGLSGSTLGDSLKKQGAHKPKKAKQPKHAKQAKARVPTVPELPGSFDHVAIEHAGVDQSYRLFVPPSAANGKPMPLVLMLHGCTQNPDDFATGTGMNQAAAEAGALVVYPAQLRNANPNACWNWFTPEHQQRGGGEPDLLVEMVRDVMARHPVDPQRIYVTGLSAGGAMASLLGREYPELFAAVGVHSGLQAGAANNMMGALSAMKSGAKGLPKVAAAAKPGDVPALIVFHGDADATVSPRNGEQLVESAVQQLGGDSVKSETLQGQSPAGQAYTRTLFHVPAAQSKGDANDVRIEQWTLHGAGHAWSGGAANGSHTDPRGVNATQEMLRFFLEHPKANAAPAPAVAPAPAAAETTIAAAADQPL